MLFRSVSLDLSGIDAETRSLPIVLATETPVPVFDVSRMEVVQEVIEMNGLEKGEKIPLLDSHESHSVRSVLGSIREIEIKDNQLIGRAYFASDSKSQRVFEHYRDGHIEDFSVGALRRSVAYRDGVRYVTRSQLIEGSAVVRGGDPNAKVSPALRAYQDPYSMRDEAMLDELRELCIKRGMPTDLEDKAMLEWLDGEMNRKAQPASDATKDDDSEIKRILGKLLESSAKPGDPVDAKDQLTRSIEVERKRIADITQICRTHSVKDEDVQKFISDGLTRDQVATQILERQSKGGVPLGGSDTARTIESEREKFYAAVNDSLVMRSLQHSKLSPHNALEAAKRTGDVDAIQRSQKLVELYEKPAAGHENYRHIGFVDLARMFLEQDGQRIQPGMTRQEIVSRALRMSNFVEMSSHLRRDDSAYNVTGSFSNLMLDAANKTLLAAYDEAPFTYTMWVRQAPSAADFKQLNRIRFGELPDPEVIPENGKYPEKQTQDGRESYRVEKYGEMFSISMEAIVNDDLNAISRIPQMQGTAMRRKINKVCYAVLTSNPNLSDGIALFHGSSHGANLDANALSKTALDTGFKVMRTQTGLSGEGTILGLSPRYLIVPSSLAASAYTLTASVADPSVGGDTTGSSGVRNIYGPGGPRPLMTIEEPQLDGSSATGWYLAADSSQIDTVEITFLAGEESPVLDRMDGFEVDSVKYKIRQTFATKAIDYRGLYKGNS